MPIADGVDMTPEAAALAGFCPECGRTLTADEVETEIAHHWPRGLNPAIANPDAIARADLMRKMFAPKRGKN